MCSSSWPNLFLGAHGSYCLLLLHGINNFLSCILFMQELNHRKRGWWFRYLKADSGFPYLREAKHHLVCIQLHPYCFATLHDVLSKSRGWGQQTKWRRRLILIYYVYYLDHACCAILHQYRYGGPRKERHTKCLRRKYLAIDRGKDWAILGISSNKASILSRKMVCLGLTSSRLHCCFRTLLYHEWSRNRFCSLHSCWFCFIHWNGSLLFHIMEISWRKERRRRKNEKTHQRKDIGRSQQPYAINQNKNLQYPSRARG